MAVVLPKGLGPRDQEGARRACGEFRGPRLTARTGRLSVKSKGMSPVPGYHRSRIQQLIQQACGYRNRELFKRDVLFHLGGLDLYPAFSQ